MKHINLRAVGLGLLVDISGSIGVGIALGILIAAIAAYDHDVSPAHMTALRANFFLRLLGLIGTTLFTALGGYVAARRTVPHGLANALAVGAVSLCLGITLALIAPGVTPIWKLVAGILATVPAAWLGGYVAISRGAIARVGV
jgi:hypothetical protein